MTKEEKRVMRAAIILVNQWRQGLRNNQVFEKDLWKAVDSLEGEITVDEKWLRAGRWTDK